MSQINDVLKEVQKVFSATEKTLLGMKDGDRVHLDELVAKATAESGVHAKEVSSFVRFFVISTDLAHISLGKNGGVIRGQKKATPAPKPVTKKAAKSKTSDTSDND